MSVSSIFFKSISKGAGIIAAAIGVSVMAGWSFDIQSLISILPQMPPMVMSTAICFVLAGIALTIAVGGFEESPFKKYASLAFRVIVLLIGVLVLSEYIFNIDLIKRLTPGETALQARMSPYSAANFMLIGVSLLLINFRDGIFSQWLAISACIITLLSFIGYAYGIENHYSIAYSQGMAFHSSITFFLLSAGILFARPDTGIMRVVSSERTGGLLVRRLLPIAVLLPIVLGWLRLKGEHAGLYTTELGLLIFTASNIVILVAIILYYTRFFDISDIERLEAQGNLRKVNRALMTLSKCNKVLVKAVSEKELLDSICASIVEAGGYRLAWVGYANDDTGVQIRACAVHKDKVQNKTDLLWAYMGCGKGLAHEVVRTGMPVIRKDRFCGPFLSGCVQGVKDGKEFLIALPLVSEGSTFGALCIYTSEPDAFDSKEEGLLMELADDLSYGIMALRTHAENKRIDEENRLLKTIALSIAETEDMQSAIGTVLNKVCELTRWAFGEAWIPSRDGTVFECARVWACGMEHESFASYSEGVNFRLGEGLPGRVWKLREPEWIYDVIVNGDVYSRTKAAYRVNLRAAFGVPIIAGGNVLAVLVFYRTEPGQEDEPAVKVISAAAAQLGSVMQRKLVEGALKESEHKYRLLVENLPQRIFLKDRNSVYISCNGNYASDLKIEQEEIKGKTDFEFHPGHLAEKYRTDDRYIMESGVVMDIDEGYIKDGQEFFVHTIKTPVRDVQGNVIGVLGLFWDITESRRAEEEKKKLEEQIRQMQKMEAVGQLTSGIAHDFNNILAAIMISGSLIEKKVVDPKLKHLVQQILAASEKASNLTKGLLAFSRKQVIDIRPVSLNNIVSNLENLLAMIIGEEIEFRVDIPEEDIGIMADSGQIEQVLINMATNARDAMPEGGRLSVTAKAVDLDDSFAKAHAMDSPGHFAMITITDTGTGMDSSTTQRIFEPFFTTKEVGKGTGLGLSIVYGIVKQHNGFINVYSELGKGSSFRIYLPSAKTRA